MELTEKRISHILWVDGMKGLCAIIVVTHHLFIMGHGEPYYKGNFLLFTPFLRDFINGPLAVSIFIFLSALLTCHGLKRKEENRLRAYTAILSKRYFRLLFPVGLIVLLMKVSNELGWSYAEQYGRLTQNEWLQGQNTTWIHLPHSIFLAPLGGCGAILNVAWMLGYVFFGTILVIAIDIIMQEKSRRAQIFLYVLMLVIAYRYDPYYMNVVVAYALYHLKPIGGVKQLRH